MLQEQRFEYILKELSKKSAVEVTLLAKSLKASESTIRRDINELDEKKLLKKVFGGATRINSTVNTMDADILVRQTEHPKEKDEIAKYAAGLINENDFVFIDAGSTTEHMISYIDTNLCEHVSFVTNGITQAVMLSKKGFRVLVTGGTLKASTEALVGDSTMEFLDNCNFTKAFLGVNGIDAERGFTTPGMDEAKVKSKVIKRSYLAYILADSCKFGNVSSVTFGSLDSGCIITDKLTDQAYRKLTVIEEVE